MFTYILRHTNMHLFIYILWLMNWVVDDTDYLLNICLINASEKYVPMFRVHMQIG